MSLKRHFVRIAVILLATLGALPAAHAATIVWNGGTGVFGTGTNWAGNVAPGPGDTASFTGSGSNCNINAATTVGAINLAVGMNLTQSSGMTLTVIGSFTQSAGTFVGGNSTIAIGGSLNLSNGTFNSTSGLLAIGGAFNKTGGTFTHNSGRVLIGSTGNQTFATNGATFYDLIVNDGLVGYWKLDEGSGTSVADSSGCGNGGTLLNTPTWAAGPALNFTNANSMVLNGTSQYASLGNPGVMNITGEITMAAWVKIGSTSGNERNIVAHGYDTNNEVFLRIDAGSYQVGSYVNPTNYYTSYAIPGGDVGAWVHLAGVYDGTTWRLYRNGVQVSSSAQAVGAVTVTSNWAIGARGDGTSRWFQGSIDDVRIYNRGLEASEIQSLYIGNQPGTSSTTLAMTGSPTVANDLTLASGTLSAGSNNMTVSGSWKNYGGIFSAGTGTVILNSSTPEVIRSAGQPFNNLTLNGSGATWTLEDWLKVNASLTMTSGTVSPGAYAIHVSNLNKTGGTLTAGTGTVVIDTRSGVTQSTGFTFNNLRIETPNEPNLVGYWKLDEGQGTTLRDVSGTGNNGTLNGNADWVSTSLPAIGFDNHAAGRFNGATAYARVSRTTSLEPAAVTVSAWVKRNGAQSQWAKIVDKTYGNSLSSPPSTYELHVNDTGTDPSIVTFETGTTGPLGDSVNSATGALADGTWTHVLGVFDPAGSAPQFRLYVNGVLSASKTRTTALIYDTSSTGDLYFGQTGNNSQYFNGQIDDVRIYNVALTNAQIQSLAAGRYAGTGSGATVTSGSNLAVNGTLAIDNGTLATSTFNVNAAGLTLANGSMTQGTGSAVALTGAYAQTGGTYTGGSSTFSVGGTSTFSGGTFTAGTGNVTLTGATTINGAGTINAGSSSSFNLNSTLAIGSGTSGTFNANAAAVTFTGAVTLQNGGAFNGNTGSGTFSAAPTFTNGTFTVADAGSTGRWTFNQSTGFSSGVTLAFPTDKGELSLSPGKTLTLNGPVTSNVGASSTLPKIDCNGCAAGQGITVAFAATSTLNINGLEFHDSVATGVSAANGATYTLFKRLKFLNNVGGVGSTHLLLTLGSAVVNAPGCYFDATAAHNVTLYGAAASPAGARAIFEDQGSATNGSGSGEALDQDGDTTADNVGDSTSTSPYYGSTIEWVRASATDTAGAVVGFPAPAFDWNTFAYYGVYVAYKDTAGASTADVLWRRNDDGTAAASYSVPQASGDIVGTPFWDTVNETTAAVDANGNGNQTDTDVHVIYIATTLGHIIKLVDTGSGFAVPASGPWATDFSSPATVATITSPLSEDRTNLYFGGTNGSGPCIFGVQIAGGANEKTLQRTVGSVSLVTTTPSWSVYGGSTYVFVGSTATASQAYLYRVNMSAGNVNASYSGVTSNVNDSATLVKNRAYAVTDGGTLHVLDASNFGTGAFKNLTGFPYQSAAASPIKAAPWVDYKTSYAYFGDNGGNLYVVTNTGADLAGYPFSISASIKMSSSPMYRPGTGVIAAGANDGYIYFVDRHNASNVPKVFNRYFITSSGTVSTVSYDSNISSYLVASSDGKLVFIAAADVSDPTAGTE